MVVSQPKRSLTAQVKCWCSFGARCASSQRTLPKHLRSLTRGTKENLERQISPSDSTNIRFSYLRRTRTLHGTHLTRANLASWPLKNSPGFTSRKNKNIWTILTLAIRFKTTFTKVSLRNVRRSVTVLRKNWSRQCRPNSVQQVPTIGTRRKIAVTASDNYHLTISMNWCTTTTTRCMFKRRKTVISTSIRWELITRNSLKSSETLTPTSSRPILNRNWLEISTNRPMHNTGTSSQLGSTKIWKLCHLCKTVAALPSPWPTYQVHPTAPWISTLRKTSCRSIFKRQSLALP